MHSMLFILRCTDCVVCTLQVPRCRENYEEIWKQSEAMIYTGRDDDDGSDV